MVKWTGKIGALALILSLWAWPLMACMVPDSLLTMEERECCKEMADECGQMDMPSSHSCCKVTVRQVDPYLAISRFASVQRQTVATPLAPVADIFATVSLGHSEQLLRAHSPPVLPAETIFILRI